MSYLEITNLYKNYKHSSDEVHVLKGINLSIEKGEILILSGISGAGKSTLLNLIGTLDHFDQGEIQLDNLFYSQLKEEDKDNLRKNHLGFIFQFHHLLPDFTALENVILPQLVIKENPKNAEKKALNLLERMGISHRKNHRPNQLSGGEQQRVAIARALINDPKLILADEPSGNLDEQNSIELHNLIYELNRDLEQTFIIVSHDVNLWDNKCRFVRLENGKVCP